MQGQNKAGWKQYHDQAINFPDEGLLHDDATHSCIVVFYQGLEPCQACQCSALVMK